MPAEPIAPGPHTALRTGVVWDLLTTALEQRAHAAGRSSLAVLDAGGGSGSLAVRVAALGHQVTVVDPSPDALFALRPRTAEEQAADRIRGVQGDTGDLLEVAGEGAYDVVLCHGVLEHVEDPQVSVSAVARALRPEGGTLSLLAAGSGGAALARALAGRFSEARHALADPDGSWGEGDPVPRRFTAARLTALVTAESLVPGPLHGVRIFTDLVPGTQLDTEPDALRELTSLEAEAAREPAFQAIAGQLHLLARRGGGVPEKSDGAARA